MLFEHPGFIAQPHMLSLLVLHRRQGLPSASPLSLPPLPELRPESTESTLHLQVDSSFTHRELGLGCFVLRASGPPEEWIAILAVGLT